MTTNFNDLFWHDATVRFIYIDRQNPGLQDVIKLLIDWPDGISSSTIEFYDCYAFTANMNFGIVACESVLSAECLSDSIELTTIRDKWLKVGINLESLRCYQIITNSTNSNLNIFALGFRFVDQN